MTFDPSKPVQTRDGRKARIICTDARLRDGRTIAALVDMGDHESGWQFLPSGQHDADREDSIDLINIPVKREGWVSVSSTPGGSRWISGTPWPTKERAMEEPMIYRVAVTRVEWEEPA